MDTHDPDIIALQETKVHDDQFPRLEIEALGYRVDYHGQKGHYGVALLAKQPALKVVRGFDSDDQDAQRRFIAGWYQTSGGQVITVLNGYFPQGENREHPTKFPAKQRFYDDLKKYLGEFDLGSELIAVVGDMNVAPDDLDVGIGEQNARRWLRQGKSCFLPEERQWLQQVQSCGLIDSFRALHPDAGDCYSWFDYRSRGFEQQPKRGLRIDLILTSAALHRQCRDCGIDYAIRTMEKPSDHCPVWAQFDL